MSEPTVRVKDLVDLDKIDAFSWEVMQLADHHELSSFEMLMAMTVIGSTVERRRLRETLDFMDKHE